MRSTRRARRFGALASGLLLYLTAIRIGSLLSDLDLPRAAYAALGGRYSVTAVVFESLLIALLLFGLALAWSRVTVRPLLPGQRPVTDCYLVGIALAWFCAAIYGTVYLSLSWELKDLPVGLWLLSSGTPPLWGVLNAVAVVGGVLLARRQMVPIANQIEPLRPDLVV